MVALATLSFQVEINLPVRIDLGQFQLISTGAPDNVRRWETHLLPLLSSPRMGVPPPIAHRCPPAQCWQGEAMQPRPWSQSAGSKSRPRHQPPRWPQAHPSARPWACSPAATGIMTAAPSQRPNEQRSQHSARLGGGTV